MATRTCLFFVLIIVSILAYQTAAVQPDYCRDPAETGLCLGYFQKFAYTPSGHCEKFVYGGCGGNRNRFDTKEACEEMCVNTKSN